ncbi:hypothetical protein, partial [Argonema galeatum]|uniref:hypothetical protein n=1 Tax=Argonema galeatum TaxID=2942762 RepID=UPI0020110E42
TNTLAKPKNGLARVGWVEARNPINALGFVPQPNLLRNGEGIVKKTGVHRVDFMRLQAAVSVILTIFWQWGIENRKLVENVTDFKSK